MSIIMTELPSEELLCQLIQEVKLDEQKNAEFCHLCGHSQNNHKSTSHLFTPALEEYRCITCGLWFYQHLNKKSNCFDEYIRG